MPRSWSRTSAEVALGDVADEIARLAVERVELLPGSSAMLRALGVDLLLQLRPTRCATCASSCWSDATSSVLVLPGLREDGTRLRRRSAARRRRPPRPRRAGPRGRAASRNWSRATRVVLVARVAEADLRAPHLDLPAKLRHLVAVELEVVLVGVELGLEALHARGIARDALLRTVAQHPPEAVDGRLERVDLDRPLRELPATARSTAPTPCRSRSAKSRRLDGQALDGRHERAPLLADLADLARRGRPAPRRRGRARASAARARRG